MIYVSLMTCYRLVNVAVCPNKMRTGLGTWLIRYLPTQIHGLDRFFYTFIKHLMKMDSDSIYSHYINLIGHLWMDYFIKHPISEINLRTDLLQSVYSSFS